MAKETNDTQDFLLDVLDFAAYKIRKGGCTKDTIDRWANVVARELDVDATTADIAQHYGQKVENVHNVLKRRPIPKDKKPTRKVYFSFNLFAKLKPKSWHKANTVPPTLL